jgi:TMEM175 potassium channel family protein
MPKTRVEAFSDGVIAILITIMVLELRAPHEPTLAALRPLHSTFLAYVLSFVYVGIYWTNHHHLFHATHRIGGAVLWANLHLLFWLSLMPFATAWMGDNHNAQVPTAFYGGVLLMASIAYYILVRAILRVEGAQSPLGVAIGSDIKGKTSTALYVCAIPLAFVSPLLADGIYVGVALIWLIPDRRIESRIL